MTIRLLFSAAASLVLTVALWAQSSSAILGSWQSEKHGSPWLIVNVRREANSKPGGTAIFFVLDSIDAATPKILGKQEVPLIDTKLAGNVFSFKVRNRQGDMIMNPYSGELLSFEMILRDDTHAMLKSSTGSDVPLVKE